MLSVSHLSVHFSGRYLFDDISFLVNKSDRIGLTGKNGAGKSTLLKIIAGLQSPEEGEIARPSDFTIGYLPQEMDHQGGKSVFDEALNAFRPLLDMQDEIHSLENSISSATDTHTDEFMDQLTRLHELQEKFGLLGGYLMESETEKVLLGLGFNRDDFQKPTEIFSGGWRMRIELAKILLQKPDLLLLDEPTNHLDIESIQWLEIFLKNYAGALIMVSHDRVFLDTVTNRTIEITLGKIEDYKASYSRYLILRAERREQQLSAFENQQKQIQDMERFVERFRAKATKAKQAQSRLKQLEKIERIEIEDEEIAAMRFRFPEPPRSGKVVAHTTHLVKKYDTKTVLSDISLEIERGDRIAFVGKNGEGKSTLSKILAGKESLTSGKLETGHNVHLGYYAQNQADSLDPDKTVLATIDDAARGEMRTKVRALLGAFLFSGQSVDKKVKVLSGGEKARLALAKMLLEPINFLIMDEPTNHLDMMSKDILKEALMNYSGALVIVSHDRDFLQGLTQKVYEFKNQKLKLHIGDVYSYLQDRRLEDLAALDKASGKTAAPKPQPKANESSKKNELPREERRQIENRRKKIERSIEEIEEKIHTLEQSIAETEKEMADPAKSALQFQLLQKHHDMQTDLQKRMSEWERMAQDLDEVKKKLEG
jgi:ATP-binding cassette subfamily F protein 3